MQFWITWTTSSWITSLLKTWVFNFLLVGKVLFGIQQKNQAGKEGRERELWCPMTSPRWWKTTSRSGFSKDMDVFSKELENFPLKIFSRAIISLNLEFCHADVMSLSRFHGTRMTLKEDPTCTSPRIQMPQHLQMLLQERVVISGDLWLVLKVSMCWRSILSSGAVAMLFWRNPVALRQGRVTAWARLSTEHLGVWMEPRLLSFLVFCLHYMVAYLSFSFFFPFSLRATCTLGTCSVTELHS